MPTARAVRIEGAGGPEVLRLGELEVRDPGYQEVLVEVAAAGLNRADTLQRRGYDPAPPGAVADVPGLEFAGTVSAVGAEVTAVRVGQRVMGITAGGAMATYLIAHERELIPVPDNLGLEDAAAIPEVFLTAYDALFEQASVGLGDNVLIHSVGSGIGTAALQLCRVAGAHPFGTSRTQAKLNRCAALGLEHGILVTEGRFADELRVLTGDRLADVILDTVGGAYLEENVRALGHRGRMVVIGLLGGVKGTAVLGNLLPRRASITGTVLRNRHLEEKITLAQHFASRVLPLFASGRLTPIVDDVLPMEQVAEAHRRMEANETFGKLVLRW
jgi:NADPH:quinone reductase